MVSVHWLDFSATDSSGCLFLLFVTNAGVELYELTTEKEKPTVGAGGLAGAAVSSGLSPTSKSKLRHVKTATYALVYHWLLVDENILMLVDGNNVFQAYRLSSKHIQKICKFELDCAGTSLHPPAMVQFHREQISLVWLYGRMVILFVNEQKGQLHLLSLVAPGQSDEMEQTHVFDLFAPGKYDISHIDNVLLVHNAATKTTMIFDVRSEGKNTIAEPLAIGPPLAFVQGAATGAINGAGANGGSSSGLHFFDPASLSALSAGASASAVDARLAGAATASTTGGMSSLAPASFHPYVKWTFLAPSYVWESTGDQQQGNLWTLQLNLHQIARSWPHAKRTRLVDFLLKRSSVAAKQLVLEVILQIVCTEPASLALLSRLFSLLNRMNYDHRMSPNAPLTNAASIANLPLRPPFSNPPSAAPTAPNSQAASPAPMGGTRPPSQSVSPYRPTTSLPGSTIGSPLAQGQLPTFHSRITSPVHHNRSTSVSLAASNSFSATAAAATAAAAALAADPLPAVDIDDSISVLSCEMVDVSLLQSQPLTVEHNLHGYMLVSQLDVFLHVFERARPHIPIAQLIPAVVEYMRSLHRHFLKVDDLLNDLLVSLLLQDGRHYECHQYLQYHILNDSLPIANRLIQCAPVYAPAYQLGIDMLYRLNQIPRLAKVLLQRGEVLAALKLVPSFRAGAAGGLFDTWGLFPRDFLQVASNTGCDVTFYHTYRFFEQRNVALRGQTAFVSGDGCDEFVRAFQDKFGPAANEHRQYLNLGDDDDDDDGHEQRRTHDEGRTDRRAQTRYSLARFVLLGAVLLCAQMTTTSSTSDRSPPSSPYPPPLLHPPSRHPPPPPAPRRPSRFVCRRRRTCRRRFRRVSRRRCLPAPRTRRTRRRRADSEPSHEPRRSRR